MITSHKTRALTHRNIFKSIRNPDIMVFATAAPVAFALLFAFVFGSAMEISGSTYREYIIVGIFVQTMLLTSTNTGIGLAMGWRIRTGPLEAVAGFGLLLLFAYALSLASAWIGLKVRSPEVLSNVSMLTTLPLAFISTAFVPTEGMPIPMRIVAEWNPVSAVVTGVRNLFGNVPEATPLSEALPLQFPVTAGLVTISAALLVFVSLATRSFVSSRAR
ncbi:putative ABC transporter membrane protein [Leucobacter sp. 7(1)]|uniref:ABC transporter permease n=1 Tax=Leucobacter sp. 7(1) TaxID=1255613 RepID=UPI00097EC67D|nr:ABC transporter permease [Leucobacter sp. 7(1)]SJN11974.1 putative ABC transporter membrane protein [Leucobacter sp. 7(1)]